MSELQVKTMTDFIAEGIDPDILFWVGSAGSFDDRAKKITKAFVKILNIAKVNFGVLGTEESSSVDAAKRAGNEFLFQMQALMNIEILTRICNLLDECNPTKSDHIGSHKELIQFV